MFSWVEACCPEICHPNRLEKLRAFNILKPIRVYPQLPWNPFKILKMTPRAYDSHVTQLICRYKWVKAPNICFKVPQSSNICLGANQASKSEVCQSLDQKAKKADKEDGRGWQCYFSHSSCLVFMVFDRAWSLSLSLSLSFHLQPHA